MDDTDIRNTNNKNSLMNITEQQDTTYEYREYTYVMDRTDFHDKTNKYISPNISMIAPQQEICAINKENIAYKDHTK